MIDDGFQAFGLLQPAPEEWDASLHLKHLPRTRGDT
jgi:hypothetical protein